MTESEVRNLLLVKQFRDHAADHQKNQSSFEQILAVHHLHIAVEIFMKTVIHTKDSKIKTDRLNFDQLIEQTGSALGEKSIQYRDGLERLNKSRNMGQHSALSVSSSSTRDLLGLVDLFFSHYFDVVYGISLSDISISKMLVSEKHRRLMALSDRLINTGSFFNAFVPSYLAMVTVAYENTEAFEKTLFLPHGIHSTGGVFSREDNPFISALNEKINRVYDNLVFLNSGISIGEMKIIEKYSGIISFRMGGKTVLSKDKENELLETLPAYNSVVYKFLFHMQDVGLTMTIPDFYQQIVDDVLAADGLYYRED